jgi:hypothetical protein
MPAGSPYPRPLTAPPPWLPWLEPAENGEPGPGKEDPFPGEHWPKLETIDYVSKLIGLILLLLALPWLVDKLLSHPSELPRHSAKIVRAPGSAEA